MAEPLTPITGNEQRSRTPLTSLSAKSFATADTHQYTHTLHDSSLPSSLATPSSPFLYEAERSSRSPIKTTSTASPGKARAKSRSPEKIALNDTRQHHLHQQKQQQQQRVPLTEATLRANETNLETPRHAQLKQSGGPASAHRSYSPSESCFSAFSAIPNVDMTMFAKLGLSPGKAAASPINRSSHDDGQEPTTPTHNRPNTPGTARPGRTQQEYFATNPSSPLDDGTLQLMDFTEQLNFAGRTNRSPTRTTTRNSPLKESREHAYKHQHQHQRTGSPTRSDDRFTPATPSQVRELASLLDFDLPPAPTPRSMPTISARELEGLKAGFLAQVSGLKATLSGKEAEIRALKDASSDAEARCGEAMEQLREQKNAREGLEQEKVDWERRDRETQRVLKEVRAQIRETEKDRSGMEQRLLEMERRAEEAELRAQEAESKVAGAAAGAEAVENGEAGGDAATPGSGTNKAVQVAVEKVARELHALYKAKHETKVGQLKKSYEARWAKKTDALKADVERLEGALQESRMEVEALRHELEEVKMHGNRMDAMTTIDPGKLAELETKDKELVELNSTLEKLRSDLDNVTSEKQELERRADKLASGATSDSTRIRELDGKVDALTSEIKDLKETTKQLNRDLEDMRVENSQLVATVDDFLSIDMDDGAAIPTMPETHPLPARTGNTSRPGSALSGGQEPMGVASKPSGLKGPGFGFGQSRIGMGGPTMKRSVSGNKTGGIMSNIERMGRVRGAE